VGNETLIIQELQTLREAIVVLAVVYGTLIAIMLGVIISVVSSHRN
jgi:hypothetical protein